MDEESNGVPNPKANPTLTLNLTPNSLRAIAGGGSFGLAEEASSNFGGVNRARKRVK